MKKIFGFLFVILAILGLASCNKSEAGDYKLIISAPSGAPGISIANIASNYSDKYSITLNLTADTLKTEFVNKTSDVIIAPVNLGATMYTKNQNYVLASVVTWGNLYFASQKENFNVADLNNADLTMFGAGTINDVIVKYILSEKNITIGENSSYLGSTQLTVQALLSDSNAICLVAEPALSTAMSKKNNITAISVQELFKEVSGASSYPQAGCFINVNTINEHKSVVDEFITLLEKSCELCSSDVEKISKYSVELELGSDAKIMEKAIPNSNIKYVKAKEAKNAIEYVLAINPSLFGGGNLADAFYYA